MLCYEFEDKLKLKYKAVGVTVTDAKPENCRADFGHCILTALKAAANGESVAVYSDMLNCNGAKTGCGFVDGIPNTPGGFGNFISIGAGEGFPSGERLKKSPAIAEEMIKCQHQNVLNEKDYLILNPYKNGDTADIVVLLVSPDQLSALTFLFNFESGRFDNVIAPAVSGCASVFRIPLGESKLENPRAVIGNLDIFSRPHFEENIVSFSVSFKDFCKMLENADECFFKTNAWEKIESRL